MSLTPLKSTTALVASLSLLLPHPALVTTAWAQEAELQCLDESDPPCPEGEPEAGSTPAERAEFASEQAAEAEAQAADEAAEAQAADDAAAAEAEAQAAEDAAAAEDEAQAADEAAETETQAPEEAAETEEQSGEDAPEAMAPDDPTFAEDDEAPAAATPETTEAPEDVVEETLDAQSVRTSAEEFETAIGGTGDSDAQASGGNGDDGLSNIQKALLLGLGAVAVGAVLRNGDRVVSNTGDRVVVEGEQGFTVYKDDDALLRQPGADLRTETFFDGSSRTTLDRTDGSRVETIRDARGRVLRRSAIYPDGTEYELFDDLEPVPAVDMRQFQDTRPDPRSLSVSQSDLSDLRATFREGPSRDLDRTFSLRQIREIEQVRSLVPAIDLDTVTFASGSAAIPATQARSLVQLGILIEELLFENPREVFLIEGHTDATGSDSLNLALSDRRAESVALALTESFRIPPENLIVQGYGESFLKVQTQAAEERNRRATVRRITPLLRQIAAN